MAKTVKSIAVSCVSTRPRKVAKVAPKQVGQREWLLKRYGKRAFLLPGGTLARPGVPAFPVVDSHGCFTCSLARAAYSRLSQGIARASSPAKYRSQLILARKQLIATAVRYADPSDKRNACNFAIRSAKEVL